MISDFLEFWNCIVISITLPLLRFRKNSEMSVEGVNKNMTKSPFSPVESPMGAPY